MNMRMVRKRNRDTEEGNISTGILRPDGDSSPTRNVTFEYSFLTVTVLHFVFVHIALFVILFVYDVIFPNFSLLFFPPLFNLGKFMFTTIECILL